MANVARRRKWRRGGRPLGPRWDPAGGRGPRGTARGTACTAALAHGRSREPARSNCLAGFTSPGDKLARAADWCNYCGGQLETVMWAIWAAASPCIRRVGMHRYPLRALCLAPGPGRAGRGADMVCAAGMLCVTGWAGLRRAGWWRGTHGSGIAEHGLGIARGGLGAQTWFASVLVSCVAARHSVTVPTLCAAGVSPWACAGQLAHPPNGTLGLLSRELGPWKLTAARAVARGGLPERGHAIAGGARVRGSLRSRGGKAGTWRGLRCEVGGGRTAGTGAGRTQVCRNLCRPRTCTGTGGGSCQRLLDHWCYVAEELICSGLFLSRSPGASMFGAHRGTATNGMRRASARPLRQSGVPACGAGAARRRASAQDHPTRECARLAPRPTVCPSSARQPSSQHCGSTPLHQPATAL